MLETLTGIGLATSAGLNAYIPLLMIAILDRFTNFISLPSGWEWMSNGWFMGILTALLAVEVVADKIPVIDHINDVVQTVVRPTAGGLAFGATAGASTVTVSDPGQFLSSHQWVPVVSGMLISFVVHSMKAVARPAINVSTAGVGAPVASTAEDIFSTALAFFAIVFPFLILLFVALLIWAFVAVRRWRRRRRAEKLAAKLARKQAALGTRPTAQVLTTHVPTTRAPTAPPIATTRPIPRSGPGRGTAPTVPLRDPVDPWSGAHDGNTAEIRADTTLDLWR